MSNPNCGCVSVTPHDRWHACVTRPPADWTWPGTVHRQHRNAGPLAHSPQGERLRKRVAALERLAQLRAKNALAKAIATASTTHRSSP